MAKKTKKVEEENYAAVQPAQNARIREAGMEIDAVLQKYGLVMIPIIQIQSKAQYLKDSGAVVEVPKPESSIVLPGGEGDVPSQLLDILRPNGDSFSH